MKKKGYIISIFIFLSSVFIQSVIAQITDENTYLINQYFQMNKDVTAVVSPKASETTTQTQLNVVSLNQIGAENQIDIKGSSSNSQNVHQKGQDNYYQFINYYNNNPSNFNILQQGSSNSLQIYGQNSIIENISIVQKSNSKALIITNY